MFPKMFDFIYKNYSLSLFCLSSLKFEAPLLSLIILNKSSSFSNFAIFFYLFLGSFAFNNIAFFLSKLFFSNKTFFLNLYKNHDFIKNLHRYKIFFIIFYRFISGFKLIFPFFIAQYSNVKEFLFFNFIGDLLWSYLFSQLGFILSKNYDTLTVTIFLILLICNYIVSLLFMFFCYKYILKQG